MYLKKRHINLKGGGGAYKYYATIVTQDADWLHALIAKKMQKHFGYKWNSDSLY